VSAGRWSGRRLHLIGVGGAGMSAYARAAHELGASVTGSDQSESEFSRGLLADAVLSELHIGHAAENIPAGEDVEVFVSSAIATANPEREAAAQRGLRVGSRAELLAELSALRRTIAVAGAHGKTTVASMIAVVLRRSLGHGRVARRRGRRVR
jgi:UDP-N-acetylmuramate--alanine ligase